MSEDIQLLIGIHCLILCLLAFAYNTVYFIPVLVLFFTVALLSIIYIATRDWVIIYNRLVNLQVEAQQRFATVDIFLEKLVNQNVDLKALASSYNKHERETMVKVIETRNKLKDEKDTSKKIKLAQELETNLFKINALAEQYPNLKAVRSIKLAMDKSAELFGELQYAKQDYNLAVQEYNKVIRILPDWIVAKLMKFQPMNYYSIGNIEFNRIGTYNPTIAGY